MTWGFSFLEMLIGVAIYVVLGFIYRLRPQRNTLLAEYIGALARRGLPLADGLDAYSADQRRGYARAVARVAAMVRSGTSLGEALSCKGRPFPRKLAAMAHAGEITGTLPETMERYASHSQYGEKNIQKLSVVLLYPCIIMMVLLLLSVVVMIKIVPQFQQMYEEMGLKLPWTTQLLVSTSAWLKGNWHIPAGAFFVAFALVILFLGLDWRLLRARSSRWNSGVWAVLLLLIGLSAARYGRALFGVLYCGLALLGLCLTFRMAAQQLRELFRPGSRSVPVHSMPGTLLAVLTDRGKRLGSTATFCETLSVLLDAEVPTPRAAVLAAEAARAVADDGAMVRLVDAVEEGEKLSSAMVRELCLPASEAWLISSADGSEMFPQALKEVAWRNELWASKRVVLLSEFIIPVCVLLEGLFVAFIVAALFLPILSLTSLY